MEMMDHLEQMVRMEPLETEAILEDRYAEMIAS